MSQHLTLPAHRVHRADRADPGARPRRGALVASRLVAVAVLAVVLVGGARVVVLHTAALSAGRIDTSRPTVAHLDPALLAAVEAAARDARADGVALGVTSGWRSRAHQQRLLDEAVASRGSLAEARRFVATPDTSAHVTGDAVDVGPREADAWLHAHGPAYGLCQVFANEPWHFELATSPGGTCPPMLPDSSHR